MQQVVSLEYLRLIHRSMILDNIWTRFFLGGATYTRERLIGEYIRYALFSDRQHLSCDVCLDSGGKKGKYQNCSVLYCVLLYRVWCKYAVYSAECYLFTLCRGACRHHGQTCLKPTAMRRNARRIDFPAIRRRCHPLA